MSILPGFLKTIKYRVTDEGHKWQSEKTSSQSVVMGDGTDNTDTVEKRFGKMKGITSSLASTSDEYALSAKAGKNLQDNLNNHTHDDRYYTKKEINDKLAQKSKVTVESQILTGNGGNWILVSNSGKKLVAAQMVRDDTGFGIKAINKQSATGLYTLIFDEVVEKDSKILVWLTWID